MSTSSTSTQLHRTRQWVDRGFAWLCGAATLVSVARLAILIGKIVLEGWARLDWQLLTSFPSRFPEQAGIKAALAGSLWLILLTAIVSVVVGVGAAVYLEEYAPKSRLRGLIQTNIANLAGVPSIVYGILGLGLFVRALALQRSLIAGARNAFVGDLAYHHLGLAGSSPRDTRFHSACVLRTGGNAMADHSPPGITRRDTWHDDRSDFGPIASSWGSRTAGDDWGLELRGFCSAWPGRSVYGFTHSDIQLDVPPSAGVS